MINRRTERLVFVSETVSRMTGGVKALLNFNSLESGFQLTLQSQFNTMQTADRTSNPHPVGILS